MLKGFTSSFGKFSVKFGAVEYLSKIWHQTVSKTSGEKALADTTTQYLSISSAGLALDASGHTTSVMVITGHSLVLWDVMRFKTAPFVGIEAQVVEVIDVNTVRIGTKLPSVPAGSETFDQLKFVTPSVDANGNVLTIAGSRAPVDFLDVGILIPTGGNVINGSAGALLTVVAAMASAAVEVQSVQDIGEPISLFVNGVFHTYLPLTPDEKTPVSINAGDSVELRASKTTAIDDATAFIELIFIG